MVKNPNCIFVYQISNSSRSNTCPSNNNDLECSGNGVCVGSTCTCNAQYSGRACNVEKCPNNCSNNGVCDMEKHQCVCNEGYRGRNYTNIFNFCLTMLTVI